LPYVRELRAIIVNLEGRLAALERQSEPSSGGLHDTIINLERRLATLERPSKQLSSVTDAPRERMEQALGMASEFWSACDCRVLAERPPILVDLLHGDVEYLWRNLTIAKIVQSITRAPLVGMLGVPGIVDPARDYVSLSDNIRLAGAFGVVHFVEVPDRDVPDGVERSARTVIAELAASHPDGTPLPRSAISRLREIRTDSGFPIGRSLQASFMRGELQPTVLAGDRLLHWMKRVLGFHVFAQQLISSMRPSIFVTGHIDYCPWGDLAELLVQHGGRVVWWRAECRIPIHLFDRLDEGSTLNGMMRQVEREAFADFERHIDDDADLSDRIDILAAARFAAVRKGLGRNWRWVPTDQFTRIQPIPVSVSLPNYCLFTHTFTDQPTADEALFVDHLEWLEETCRHAATSRAYNLIIKVHPWDRRYDRSGAIDRLAFEFRGAENIHFMRDQIEPEQLANHCELGITVRGTPGLEMTGLGLPMMLAGRGPYSDTGVCMTPPTRSEYFELLKKGPPFPIDIAKQSRRARRFLAFDRHWSAPMTQLVPPFGARTIDADLWALVAEGVRSACLESDQVTRAIAQAWRKGSAKVVVPELQNLFGCGLQ
jgi:hypothetical protein